MIQPKKLTITADEEGEKLSMESDGEPAPIDMEANTYASEIWNDPPNIIFNPWSSRDGSQAIQGYFQTYWAENIHKNYEQGNFKHPATFDWSDEVIYIVGHGVSLPKHKAFLEAPERPGIALYLNVAAERVKAQYQDFMFSTDHEVNLSGALKKHKVILHPGIAPEKFKDWGKVYGIGFWPHSPLNDYMERRFPHLPLLNECISGQVSATHLAVLNGARTIVFMGSDLSVPAGASADKMAHEDAVLEYRGVDGEQAFTTREYARISQAITQQCIFAAHKYPELNIINATGRGILGLDLLAEGAPPVRCFQFFKGE